MEKIRLGLIGIGDMLSIKNAGRGRGLFIASAKSFDNVEATAICDINQEHFGVIKDSYPQVECFTDYKQMFETAGLDAVIVATPANNHAEFTIAALKHDINVLSEIPIVFNLDEVDALIAAEKASKAIFMTGSNANFAGRLRDLQEMHKNGMLGEPFYMEVSYMHDLRNWFAETPWRAKQEPIRYCTHSLGPLLTLFDEDLEYVSCFDTGGWMEKGKPNRHDVMTALFKTKSNRVIQLSTSFANNFKDSDCHRCVVHGTEGVFSWINNKVHFNSTRLPGAHRPVELHSRRMDRRYANNPRAIEGGHGGLDYVMLEAFFDSIANSTESPISLKEGLRMSLPGIFAAESARNGGILTKIKYPWNK